MPWLTVEYSDNLQTAISLDKTVIALLHGLVAEVINTEVSSCKTKCTVITSFLLGEQHNENHAFLLCTIKILPGRSDDVKIQLKKQLAEFFKKQLNTVLPTDICVSVEELLCYEKIVINAQV